MGQGGTPLSLEKSLLACFFHLFAVKVSKVLGRKSVDYNLTFKEGLRIFDDLIARLAKQILR